MGEGRGHTIARQVPPLVIAGAAITLGVLLQFTNGSVPPGLMSRAMLGLSIPVGLTAWGVLGARRDRLRESNSTGAPGVRLPESILVTGLFLQLALFAFKRPALSLPLDDRSWILPFAIGLPVVALAAWLALRNWPRFGRWLLPVSIGVFLLLGVWVIRHTPDPGIDVITFQREGLGALSKGVNPYAITMPQVYGNSEYYGSGLTENGRLLIGVPYPPLSLLIEWPFHFLFGDFRYALLIGLAGAAVLLSRITRDRTGALVAALLLFMPRSFFVVEQGWTESLVVLALAGVVYAALRKPLWLAFALGLFFAMKQYAVFLAPAAFLLVPPADWRRMTGILAKAILIALAITLPFALWDPAGFYRSVILFQFLQPFRNDSLSYLAWYARVTGSTPQSWVGFVMMFAAMSLVIWKAPRTVAGFAAGGGLILLVFFAFNKQAFCNYYFVVIGALWCAVAARGRA